MGRMVMSGWMHKEGAKVKNWKNRFFTLDSRHVLRYFKSEDAPKEAGCIDMTLCRGIICADKCKCDWALGIDQTLAFGIVTPKRTYHIYGDCLNEVQQWMLAFKRAARITSAIPLGNPLIEGSNEVEVKARVNAYEDHARRMTMIISQGSAALELLENEQLTIPEEARSQTISYSDTREDNVFPVNKDSTPKNEKTLNDKAASTRRFSLRFRSRKAKIPEPDLSAEAKHGIVVQDFITSSGISSSSHETATANLLNDDVSEAKEIDQVSGEVEATTHDTIIKPSQSISQKNTLSALKRIAGLLSEGDEDVEILSSEKSKFSYQNSDNDDNPYFDGDAKNNNQLFLNNANDNDRCIRGMDVINTDGSESDCVSQTNHHYGDSDEECDTEAYEMGDLTLHETMVHLRKCIHASRRVTGGKNDGKSLSVSSSDTSDFFSDKEE